MNIHDDSNIERLISFVRKRIDYGMDIVDVVSGAQKAFVWASNEQIYLAYKAARVLNADVEEK
jgi:hypothetical protein